MGVGQSGLSKSIRRLERELRMPLFLRRNLGVELTPEGQRLRRTLDEVAATWRASVDAAAAPENFRVTLGAHRAVMAAHWPPLVAKLLRAVPQAKFDLEFGTSPEITRRVAKQEVDFGIVVNHVRVSDLVARPLRTDFQALWRSPENRSERIGYNPEMIDAGKVLRRFERAQLIEVPDYHVLLAMAQAGACQSILPNTLTEGTNLRRVGEKLREVQVSLIYHSKLTSFPRHREVIRVLLA